MILTLLQRALILAFLSAAVPTPAAVSPNLLRNPDFGEGVGAHGLPVGWALYGGGGREQRIAVDAKDGGVRLEDGDPSAEIGLRQTIPAAPGLTYEASVEVGAIKEASTHGAYLQLRFLPSNELAQTALTARSGTAFSRAAVRKTAPPGTTQATVYLYTHGAPTPRLVLRAARLVSGVPPPPSSPPDPIPPVYTSVKPLHLETALVHGTAPRVTIIAPPAGPEAQQALRIQSAIRKRTGVEVPLATDSSPAAAVPITGHLITIGNRSTNRTISELYNRYFTLLDLRYPGPGGHLVRTLHNPFGGGYNVIVVGGSEPTGVQRAADAFLSCIEQTASPNGDLVVGRLAEIQLGEGVTVPTDIRAVETWEASKGYGSIGYFGWNSISKHMALYYMTGKEKHAREFLRLAFPDAAARREIAAIDGERIENKDAPLSGPYHYNAHLMILYWDLIEESPVFSDVDRLRVTNAFAKQLEHRRGEGIYGRTAPAGHVGSRHGQWSAISLYCLGRYFQRDYPHPIWRHCVESSRLAFASLNEHAWVSGENDNLFWYNTAIAPIFTYLLLTGERQPVENGVLTTLLRGQEMLVSGRAEDRALRSASIGYLHKAAHLLNDGRYVHYRTRTGVDMRVFRVGQSFWPEPSLAAEPPLDLVGRWLVHRLPRPLWEARGSGLPYDQSFQFASYRSAADATGDFLLIDGFNGASRNPYHTFAILELRLGGVTLLRGYRNQLINRMDGLVEPRVAMDAAITTQDVLGRTALVTAEVPQAPFARWRRTVVVRRETYALMVDEVLPRVAGTMEVEIQWETEGAAHRHIRTADPLETSRRGRVISMRWTGDVEQNLPRTFFSLVGRAPNEGSPLACVRLTDRMAALALPEPALVSVGSSPFGKARLLVLAGDHLFALGLEQWNLGATAAEPRKEVLHAQAPVDIDWDFQTGQLFYATTERTRLSTQAVGKPAETTTFDLPAGRHRIDNVKPNSVWLSHVRDFLAKRLKEAEEMRAKKAEARRHTALPQVASFPATSTVRVGGAVVDLEVATLPAGPVIYAAVGKTVHAVTPDGRRLRELTADGAIRVLRWWPEQRLLLVGCADEKVIAFDETGRRTWTFVSVMDPAVFRAAKTYWFKSAPGHEGIHGLFTGTFIDGKSQAFVGSACTLEILSAEGRLIRRLPQFWGKVSHFALTEGPDGSINLLASRKYSGRNTVAVINSRTLDPRPRRYDTVPPGTTYVGGWSSMNRHHIFHEDLDGDGVREVISETNGTWNRVTVWRADGRALYSANFGPGERIPIRTMRDLAIGDLDGDGKKEIVAATSGGWVVALDAQCRKRFARRLSSPPVVMTCVTPRGGTRPWIVVGCEDGTVPVLDGSGTLIRSGSVNGRPTFIDALSSSPNGPFVLVATDRGELSVFQLTR